MEKKLIDKTVECIFVMIQSKEFARDMRMNTKTKSENDY